MPRFFATTAKGIEPVTAAELTRLGATEVTVGPGGVFFEGPAEVLYRSVLWLRTAQHVLQTLREFTAINPEMLYSQTRRVRWEDYLNPEMTFAVYATIEGRGMHVREPGERREAERSAGGASNRGDSRGGDAATSRGKGAQGINHTQYAALKVKDAIVDRLRREQGARPNVDTFQPDIRIHAHFSQGRCALSLDAVGTSLHERGYRGQGVAAPLKETLAAAMVALTGWQGDVPFLDPMCGSGTLAIEAAMLGLNVAPGLSRLKFCCQHWPDFEEAVWTRVVEEAKAARKTELPFPIVARDVDPQAIAATQANAAQAGVAAHIRTEVGRAELLPAPTATPGVMLVNPPYGERLGADDDLVTLYRQLGKHWLTNYPGWQVHFLAGNLTLARHLPLVASHKTKLFNGPLECRLLSCPIGAPVPERSRGATL